MSFSDSLLHWLGFSTKKERDLKKVQVNLDPVIFQNICKTLYEEAPKDSPYLVMDVGMPLDMVAPDPEKQTTSYYVKKSNGKNVRFIPSENAEHNLVLWALQIRQSMVDQKQPPMKAIKITVDVALNKYNADFRY